MRAKVCITLAKFTGNEAKNMALFGKSRKNEPHRAREGTALGKWLDNLQQESWQLELVISGLAIFGLISGLDSLDQGMNKISQLNTGEETNYAMFVGAFIYFSWLITLVNLLIHLILRGLWIGAIGLRYISGDIDFWKLNFREPYNRQLRRKIGSYDRYIERLERLCSIIFAFTFLLILMLLSSIAVILFFIFIFKSLQWIATMLSLKMLYFGFPILVLLFIGGLFTFIDFITFSRIKRSRWLARVYYPFYWLYSIITFSFLYRAIYYNFIDNRLGRRALVLAIPYIILVFIFADTDIEGYTFWPNNYFTAEKESGQFLLNTVYYDDLRDEDTWVKYFSIPAQTVQASYLPLFLRYHPFNNKTLALQCPALDTLTRTGLHFASGFQAGAGAYKAENRSSPNQHGLLLLSCLQDMYQVYVDDSLYQIREAVLYEHPGHGERGLLTHLSIPDLPDGLHHLKITRLTNTRDSLYTTVAGIAPFWVQRE